MLKHDAYVKFKDRSKKHMNTTLNSFEFWGRKVGRIDGQIKSKFGEVRWYANLDRPNSIYEIIHVDEYTMYRWDPSKSRTNAVLDSINNFSKFFTVLLYMFVLYKLFFYNVAYWVAFFKNRDCAADILYAADYPNKILLGKRAASIAEARNKDNGD